MPEKRHRLKWGAAAGLLVLVAMLIAPFLLTTPLMRLALEQIFPARRLSVGRAALSLTGRLVLHNLVLYDTGALAQQPLVTARRVDVAFGWAAVLSHRIRRLHADGVTVYARPNGPSPLSLLDLFRDPSQSSPLPETSHGTLPLWIDTLSIQGIIRLESIKGLMSDRTDWPLVLRLTMSGDRKDPSRQFRLAIGDAQQLPEKFDATPSIVAHEVFPSTNAVFGLMMEVETRPAAGGTRVVVHHLTAHQVTLMIEADILRKYTTMLPADLYGPIDADLGILQVSGSIALGIGEVMQVSGNMRLQDLNVRSRVGGKRAFALDRLTAIGYLESQLHPWLPAALHVRDGVMQWATLRYQDHAVNNLQASWSVDDQKLVIDPVAAEIFDGHMSGTLIWDLSTHAMPRCDVQMQRINMHAVLANISPEHLDAEGYASGFLHVARSAEGELSGALELAFDEPGILRIGEIEAVEQMLVGKVGLELATRALQDLRQYPFKEGRLYLKSLGQDTELQITFVRQLEREADVTPPHPEIINGQEVWVGSVMVPTIDLTVPITGKSLVEILSIVSGVSPLHEDVSEPHGK
jgi:dicarboxylate transporter DctA-like protein